MSDHSHNIIANLVVAYIVLPTLYCAYIVGISIYFTIKMMYRRRPGYISENDILLSPIKLYSSFVERYKGGIKIDSADRILCLGLKPLTLCSADEGLLPIKWFISWYITSVFFSTVIFASIFLMMRN